MTIPRGARKAVMCKRFNTIEVEPYGVAYYLSKGYYLARWLY